MLKKFTYIVLGAAFVNFAPAEKSLAISFVVVAEDLDSPRGLAFGADGALYVTEAGKGGNGNCVPSPSAAGENLCYGATGAITKIHNGSVSRVASGLPSLALANGGDASGANDIAFDKNGKAHVILGFASNPASRDSIIKVSDFGHLISFDNLNGGSSWNKLADVLNYELVNNPDQGDPAQGGVNSNPYSLAIQNNTAFVVDAGGNDLFSVNLNNNQLDLKTVFPKRIVPNPLGGGDIPMEPVPTSVVIGPDDELYVSELTGFPFPKGGARIYKLNGSQPEVFADGFTNVIDFAFAKDKSLYVLEYATNSVLSGNPQGAIIRVAPDGTRTTITDDLISPTGILISDDDKIYVSNNGFFAGQGEVLRIDGAIPQEIPEPATVVGLLTFASWGLGKKLIK